MTDLPVYFQTERVGRIFQTEAGLAFHYDEAWVGAAGQFPVSASMPMESPPPGDAISTAWFWNLLPEEEQLKVFARRLGHHPAEIFGLLQKMGRELAGALSIGAPEAAGRYLERTDTELAADIRQLPARPLLAGEHEVTLSLAGAQSKMAVAVFDGEIHLPLAGAASTHILKPSSQRLFGSVENEAFCLRLAEAAGLSVPTVTIGEASGHPYLLIDRYDRFPDENGEIRRLHQEDAAQALGLPPLQKYQASGGPDFAGLFSILRRWGTQEIEDVLALVDRVTFNVAIGNTDAHAKNFSFLISRNGHRLAPLYDVMNVDLYEGITSNMAMKLGGARDKRHVYNKHWVQFATDVGIGRAATVKRVTDLCETLLNRADDCARTLADQTPSNRAQIQGFCDAVKSQAERTMANSIKDA